MKINIRISIYVIILLLASLFLTSCQYQNNPYGLDIVTDVSQYKELIETDPDQELIDLEKYIPGIVLDIRYATDNNFTGQKIYEAPMAFARKPVAEALFLIQEELGKSGLGLKIYDAYRPYSATLKFYEVYPDTTFVAAPWKGSVHNTGCAVDVSLVDLNTGLEIEMPTLFDDFSDKASHSCMDLPETAIHNRQLLKEIMTRFGFSIYEPEWWHYNFADKGDFGIMDIPLLQISKAYSASPH